MFTKLFWRDAIERAVSTMAQVLLSLLGVDVMNIVGLNLKAVVTSVLLGGGLSLLKSIVALRTTDGNSASFTVNNVKGK